MKGTDKVKKKTMGAAKQAGQALRGRPGIFATLSKEHGEVAALMGTLVKVSEDEPQRRRELFSQIKSMLLAHAHAEDAVFYEALESNRELSAQIEESRREHEEVEQDLKELSTMSMSSSTWMDRFEDLKEKVEHHVEEEEEEVFPRAESFLSKEEAKTLGDRYERRRKNATASVRH